MADPLRTTSPRIQHHSCHVDHAHDLPVFGSDSSHQILLLTLVVLDFQDTVPEEVESRVDTHQVAPHVDHQSNQKEEPVGQEITPARARHGHKGQQVGGKVAADLATGVLGALHRDVIVFQSGLRLSRNAPSVQDPHEEETKADESQRLAIESDGQDPHERGVRR